MSSNLNRKRNTFYSLLVILALLIAGLLYFLLTGKQPTNVIPVSVLGKPTYIFSIYGGGKHGRLNKPLGVGIDKEKNVIYVADTRNSRVVAFNPQGEVLYAFDKIKINKKDGKLRNPSYLAVNPKDNTLYVSDPGHSSIFIFDRGKFLKKYIPNKNKKFPWIPLGMTFDDKGNLYVADKGLNRVVKFDSNAKRLISVGESGMITKKIKDKPGKLYFPNDVAVNAKGDIYVSDGNNQRVQVFDSKGKFKEIIVVKGLPRGLGLIESGSSAGVYVVNVFNHQVQVLNTKGQKLFEIGESGEGEGQFRYPNDIDFDDNKMYVADRENSRIQVWRF